MWVLLEMLPKSHKSDAAAFVRNGENDQTLKVKLMFSRPIQLSNLQEGPMDIDYVERNCEQADEDAGDVEEVHKSDSCFNCSTGKEEPQSPQSQWSCQGKRRRYGRDGRKAGEWMQSWGVAVLDVEGEEEAD